MTARRPPRLALRLLERHLPDNDPLVGDLVEEFDRQPSSWWFWKQTLAAVVIASLRRSDEIRPLRLVDGQVTAIRSPISPGASTRPLRPINLSGGPVAGIGGLGLVALSVLVTVVQPAVWWLALGAVAGGLLLGVGLIAFGRRRVHASNAGLHSLRHD